MRGELHEIGAIGLLERRQRTGLTSVDERAATDRSLRREDVGESLLRRSTSARVGMADAVLRFAVMLKVVSENRDSGEEGSSRLLVTQGTRSVLIEPFSDVERAVAVEVGRGQKAVDELGLREILDLLLGSAGLEAKKEGLGGSRRFQLGGGRRGFGSVDG